MNRQIDFANITPLRLGLACSVTMLLGVLSIATMLSSMAMTFWLLCGIPMVVGLFVQFFVSSDLWRHVNFAFNFLLCALTFGIALWIAIAGSSSGDALIPTVLTLFLLISAGYLGYQSGRKHLNGQTKPNKAVSSESEYIQIAGRRVAWSTLNRIADRIAMLTPLFIAIGLNTGRMLSQQAIYWFFGGISLFSSIMFAMGTGGMLWRIVLALQERNRIR